jgi:hypothetical protein
VCSPSHTRDVYFLLSSDPCPLLSGRGGQRSFRVSEAPTDRSSFSRGLLNLGLQGIIFPQAVSGGAVCSLALASLGIPEGGFFSGGSATRCRVPSSSAMHEMVPKHNIAPTWRASYRCLVSDRTPGGTLVVLLDRTVLLTVARWFVPRSTRKREKERVERFSIGLGRFERRNTLLPGMALYAWCVYKWCFLNREVLMR